MLMILAADDPEGHARLAAFTQGLQGLGWTVGHNVQIDYRWGAGDADRTHKYAAELVALAPDAILASGTSTVAPLQRVTRTGCLRSTPSATTSSAAAWSPTGPIRLTRTGVRPAMSIESSRARSPPTCRCRRRSNTSWSSISRPPGRSASSFRQAFSPSAMSWSNKGKADICCIAIMVVIGTWRLSLRCTKFRRDWRYCGHRLAPGPDRLRGL